MKWGERGSSGRGDRVWVSAFGLPIHDFGCVTAGTSLCRVALFGGRVVVFVGLGLVLVLVGLVRGAWGGWGRGGFFGCGSVVRTSMDGRIATVRGRSTRVVVRAAGSA